MVDIKKFVELAKICKATYAAPIRHEYHSYNGKVIEKQKIVHGSFGRGFCRIFWNSNTVVIAFRGTREDVDWFISNLRILPTTLKLQDKRYPKIKVHVGFQNTLLKYFDKTTQLKSIKAIWKHIHDFDLFNGREVVITGHSLGGALATLFAVNVREKYPDYIKSNLKEIIVFGAPSVGFSKFKAYYGELNDMTIRVVNGSDIVPFTPPFFYSHIGSEIWLNKNEIKKQMKWPSRLAHSLKLPIKKFKTDHKIEEYIRILKDQE